VELQGGRWQGERVRMRRKEENERAGRRKYMTEEIKKL
jgi:hypothetical protein